MELIMPGKGEEITIKIVGKVYYTGGEKNIRFYCDCRIFGDPRTDRIFKLHITKTLGKNLIKGLEEIQEMGELGGDIGTEDSYKMDPALECLIGKIITITGDIDITKSFKTKDDRTEFAKVFGCKIRLDLMDKELHGGAIYRDAVRKEIEENEKCKYVVTRNMELAKGVTNKEVEWVKRKREREEKAKKELERLSSGGW